METLVVVAQHRNQGYTRSKSQISDRFGSSLSKGFKQINCRTFKSSNGILPSSTSVFHSCARTSEPKSPGFRSEPPKLSRRSNPIMISPKPLHKFSTFCDELSCSELWAGPAYSNSPPPSSLPIPKFSLCKKRSISLDPPVSSSGIGLKPVTKSAPASPVRDSRSPTTDLFLSATSATENLRRILNLDLLD